MEMAADRIPRLTLEELNQRDLAYINRICSDEEYACHFFYDQCRPLFCKILWKLYENHADYDELVHDLYIYLKEPGQDGQFWHRLKTFDYRTSLFDWLKIVAVRRFYTPSNEVFKVPERLVDLGVAEYLFLGINVDKYRFFLYYHYVKKMDDEQLASQLGVDPSRIAPLSRNAIRHFKNYLRSRHPDYYDSFFKDDDVKESVTLDDRHDDLVSPDEYEKVDNGLDVHKYLAVMPNEKYRLVVRRLYLEDATPEELALELGTPVSNIYNLKSRAIEQLRDIVLYFQEVNDIETYINQIPDNRNRELIRSIYVYKDDYKTICSKFKLTKTQFREQKRAAMRELKRVVFKERD
jgi:DNA-directed RNA polymerase specialized sigma24 family protein